MNHYRIILELEGDSEYDMEWIEKVVEIAVSEASSYCGFGRGIDVSASHSIQLEPVCVHWHKIGTNTP